MGLSHPARSAVADASALSAVVLQEPGFERIVARLQGATICAPEILKYELTNAAVRRARKDPLHAAEVFAALDTILDRRSGIQCTTYRPRTSRSLPESRVSAPTTPATCGWRAGWRRIWSPSTDGFRRQLGKTKSGVVSGECHAETTPDLL